MIPQEILSTLQTAFPGAILDAKVEGVTDPAIIVARDRIREICLFLRDDEKLRCDSLMCLSGVDLTGGKLSVVYHLHSLKWNHKIVLKVNLAADDPHCQSVAGIWRSADWLEREAYDMIGIIFDGHPDLRRILMPDDWEGYPLRKDYQVPEYYHGMKVPY